MKGHKCEACNRFFGEKEDHIELVVNRINKGESRSICVDICMECATDGLEFMLENKWRRKTWHSRKVK